MRKMATVCLLMTALSLYSAGKADHVVVIVWDGMRPDFVTASNTPNLWKLAQGGVTFANHHPVYISSTEVNGTAIATGCHPGISGIMANTEYRPGINLTNAVATEAMSTIRKGDQLTANHYIAAATMVETLHAANLRTVVAGSKPVAALQDRLDRGENPPGTIVFEGQSMPRSVAKNLAQLLGKFPPATNTRVLRDIWSTSALTESLWKTEVPPLTLLWLGEPDGSQHSSAPGAPLALKSIKNDDEMLGRVMTALENKNLRDKTDVILVSDHGFSTVGKSVDLVDLLKTNGIRSHRTFPTNGAVSGDVLVVGGASALIYVTGHDKTLIERITHLLQAQPCCGVVFTRNPVAGAFTLDQARIATPDAPDIVVSMRWSARTNKYETPGLIYFDTAKKTSGIGMHGTLSPFDMHNTGFAWGPDFKRGFVDECATGNLDVAPTVLWILGIKPKQPLSGRVLDEAMTSGTPGDRSIKPEHLEASYAGEGFRWRQYLNCTIVNETIYFDEGNGEQIPTL